MTLVELQRVLGERIRIATDHTLTIEERIQETGISQTISSLAKQMINNVDRKINFMLSKNKWHSTNPDLTLAAIKYAELFYKLKERETP